MDWWDPYKTFIIEIRNKIITFQEQNFQSTNWSFVNQNKGVRMKIWGISQDLQKISLGKGPFT
jgi:hypothetical protein